MKAAASVVLALPLAGCVAFAVPLPVGERDGAAGQSSTVGANGFAGPWDMVAFETNSWGTPVTAWTVLPDGSGSWTEGLRDGGAARGDVRLVRHELAANPAAYARLRAIIDTLPVPAPTTDGCADFITDQPYGKLRLEKGASVLELTYNSGCRDASYRAYTDKLREADALVADLARTGALAADPGGTASD